MGENLPRNASTNSSHVSTEPYGNDSYHVATISLKEKGKRCYHLWSHTIQLNCVCHPEEFDKVFIRILSWMTSKLILPNHGDQG